MSESERERERERFQSNLGAFVQHEQLFYPCFQPLSLSLFLSATQWCSLLLLNSRHTERHKSCTILSISHLSFGAFFCRFRSSSHFLFLFLFFSLFLYFGDLPLFQMATTKRIVCLYVWKEEEGEGHFKGARERKKVKMKESNKLYPSPFALSLPSELSFSLSLLLFRFFLAFLFFFFFFLTSSHTIFDPFYRLTCRKRKRECVRICFSFWTFPLLWVSIGGFFTETGVWVLMPPNGKPPLIIITLNSHAHLHTSKSHCVSCLIM